MSEIWTRITVIIGECLSCKRVTAVKVYCWNCRVERTNRVDPHALQMRRDEQWSDSRYTVSASEMTYIVSSGALNSTHSLTRYTAERQVIVLERNCHASSGWILRHWVRPRGRCCSGACRFSQRGKVFLVSISLRPSRSKPWAQWTRQLANSLPICEERSPQPQVMSGNKLSCSAESFSAGATLHGLMICTQLCIILILKLPREHI